MNVRLAVVVAMMAAAAAGCFPKDLIAPPYVGADAATLVFWAELDAVYVEMDDVILAELPGTREDEVADVSVKVAPGKHILRPQVYQHAYNFHPGAAPLAVDCRPGETYIFRVKMHAFGNFIQIVPSSRAEIDRASYEKERKARMKGR
jgi:hypothetical protein